MSEVYDALEHSYKVQNQLWNSQEFVGHVEVRKALVSML